MPLRQPQLPSVRLTAKNVHGHPDLALAERCRQGAPGAFEELYRNHARRLFALAARIVGPQQAEDLLQDIFLTAHRKLAQYRGESSLGTWLFRLATNLCLDHLGSRAARSARLDEPFADELDMAGTAGPILGALDRLDLEKAITALPPGCRTIFVLHDIEGQDHREISELLDIAVGTSKSQLHKARLHLRRMLNAPHPGLKNSSSGA